MKSRTFLFLAPCVTSLLAGGVLAAGDGAIIARSGPARTALLELFTSEGCSSCPPAEKWMASLLAAEGLWKDFVPVAFHVDYWDDLGWKDGLASPAFTKRQRSYARDWNASTVYTPGFVLDGREWRSQLPAAGLAAGTKDAPGRLVVEQSAPSEFRISFFPDTSFSGGVACLALLGFDRNSNVRAGENAGRELAHQFAALELGQSALSRDGRTGAWTASIRISTRQRGRLAIAAWIARPDSPAPVQSAGGSLPPPHPWLK